MIRRKRRMRRAARSLTDRIAIGAMVLSAGLLIISAITTDRSTDPGPGAEARAQDSTPRQSAGNRSEQAMRLARGGDANSSSAADTGETASRNASAQATPQNSPLEAETPAEPTNTADYDTSTDIAALESDPSGLDDASPANVARAQFTTGIDESEPVNSIRSVFSTGGQVFSLDGRPLRRLYYFTEIKDMQGETVTHRWEHEGEVIAETSFDVGADSWPVYSSENLPPAMPGNWRVVVTDAQGNIIHTDRFSYQAF